MDDPNPPSHVAILRAAHARFPEAGDLYVFSGEGECEVGIAHPHAVLATAPSRTELLRKLEGSD